MLENGQSVGMKDQHQLTINNINKYIKKKKFPEIILPDTFSQYIFWKSSSTFITLTFWSEENTVVNKNCPEALGVKGIDLNTEVWPGIVFTTALLYMFVMCWGKHCLLWRNIECGGVFCSVKRYYKILCLRVNILIRNKEKISSVFLYCRNTASQQSTTRCF